MSFRYSLLLKWIVGILKIIQLDLYRISKNVNQTQVNAFNFEKNYLLVELH